MSRGGCCSAWSMPICPHQLTWAALRTLGWEVVGPLCFGSLIYAIVCGALAYALTLRLLPVLKTWNIPRWPKPRGE